MKSTIKTLIFCLLILGIHTFVSAQPYTYWPSYNRTPIGDINQVPWIASDTIIDDWDWSLPDSIPPAPSSKLIIARNIFLNDRRIKNFPIVTMPCNPIVTHWIGWNLLEPTEDNYDWDGLRHALDLCTAKGYKSVLRFMTCRTERSAPTWFADEGIKTKTHENGEVDYDPADSIYHQHYLDLIADFGATGIQNRDDVVGLYVGYSSKSWGDEGIGPIKGEDNPFSNDKVQHVIERLDAWAAITVGIRHKMVMGGYSNHGLNLGFGIRRGFVEHYMYHTPDDIMGQKLDADNYMYVDENNPIIANNAYNGEENEEYGENWVEDGRFGNSLAAYPYRYFSSNIRLLQMRCNAVLFSEFALMPEMLAWVGLQLGRTRQDAPDIFCFLRETYIRNGVNDNVKNFERWLYQRDTPGYETEAVIPIDKNYNSWMYDANKPYDYIARKGQKIGFAADDDVFHTDVEHEVAIKVSYIDIVVGTLKLVYHNDSGPQQRIINTTGGDVVRTATFFVTAKFDATGFNYDFELQSETDKEVPVSFVRVIKTEKYAISATAENGSFVIDPQADSYLPGTQVSVTAIGDLGYGFDTWGGDLTGSENPSYIYMDGDKDITATFKETTWHTITVNAENGSVMLDPESDTYEYGAVVELTAQPDEGYEFNEWDGDISGVTNPIEIIINGDKEIIATFKEIPRYTITVNAENGTVLLEPESDSYEYGTVVKLTAHANEGYEFIKWIGEISGVTNPIEITINGDKEITATFKEIPRYTITVNAENGSVMLDPESDTYEYGTVVKLTAQADEDYEFTEWEGDISGVTNPIEITINGDKEITATFKEIPRYTITVNAENGSVTFDPESDTYEYRAVVKLTAQADEGYEFTQWNGDISGVTNPTEITINGDKSITALFDTEVGIEGLLQDKANSNMLGYNYPTPFSIKTTIPFELCELTKVNISVYNAVGRKIIQLVDQQLPAGKHKMEWYAQDENGKQIPDGMYFYQMRTSSQNVLTKKMIVVRKN